MHLTTNSVGGFSREPTLSAQSWALSRLSEAVNDLAYVSQATGDVQHSPVVLLASNETYWRVTGMEAVFQLASVTRKDVLRNPVSALTRVMKFFRQEDANARVIGAVLQLLNERDLGLAGVPPQDTRTNGTSIVRDLVNVRKKEYRTYFRLPAVHWGSCQCCSSNSHLTFIKRLGTLKGLENGQVKTLLQDIFSKNDNLEYPTLLAEVFSNTNDDELGALLHVVEGNGNVQLMSYMMAERYDHKSGNTYWSVKPYCLECVRNFEDPQSAARNAHTFKQLAKIRHEMMVSAREFRTISDAYREAVKETQKELENASTHLRESKRTAEYSNQGHTVPQRSTNFSPLDEDALARDAWAAGLTNEVIKGRKKTDLWKIKRSGNSRGKLGRKRIDRLRSLIDAKTTVSRLAAAPVDVSQMWDDIGSPNDQEE